MVQRSYSCIHTQEKRKPLTVQKRVHESAGQDYPRQQKGSTTHMHIDGDQQSGRILPSHKKEGGTGICYDAEERKETGSRIV